MPGKETKKRELDASEYFHGAMLRADAEEATRCAGDFLVRITWRGDDERIVLTICVGDTPVPVHAHYAFNVNEIGYFYIGRLRYSTVQDLVDFHWQRCDLTEGEMLDGVRDTTGHRLRRPIGRASWQLRAEWLEVLGKQIDAGSCGRVHEALLQRPGDAEPTRVAIKFCSSREAPRAKRHFLRAARLHRRLDHANIPQFYGMCTDEPTLKVALQLADERNVIKFMTAGAGKEEGVVTEALKLRFCADVADALEYLQLKPVLHLDVAARNCLVVQRAGGYGLQLSDFGMSHEGSEHVLLKDEQVAVCWAAPELLAAGERRATSKSDVWAFGVLVWELYTGCRQQPYGGACGYTPADMRAALELGQRLRFPGKTPADIDELARNNCWLFEPDARPDFTQISDFFKEQLLNRSTN